MPISQPSMTKSSSSSRAREWRGRRESDSQVSATLMRCIYYGVRRNTCHKSRVRTTTTTTTSESHLTQECLFFWEGVTCLVLLATGQPMSAAQRRKERRLRSWWRHERSSRSSLAWQLRRTTAREDVGSAGQPPGPGRWRST